MHIACGGGLDLHWQRCDMISIYGFVDDIMYFVIKWNAHVGKLSQLVKLWTWLTVEQFEFTKPLEDVKVTERDNAIFECCVSHKKVPVTWYVAGVEVVPGPKYQVLVEEFTHRLAINVAKPVDQGEVKAVFRDQTSTAQLTVERTSIDNNC